MQRPLQADPVELLHHVFEVTLGVIQELAVEAADGFVALHLELVSPRMVGRAGGGAVVKLVAANDVEAPPMLSAGPRGSQPEAVDGAGRIAGCVQGADVGGKPGGDDLAGTES